MTPKESNPQEIVGTRLLSARRGLVWKMWTEPQHVTHWWGPNGFTSTIQEIDVRPGGIWQLVLHGPDGTNYPNKSVYVEVTPPERLVFDHISNPKFRMTVTFTEKNGKTEVLVRMLFESASLRDAVARQFGAVEGLHQTLQHLEERLARFQESPDLNFVISRTFDAPSNLVYQAWTDPAHMTKWWGPKTFTTPVCELDVKPGGAYHIVMRSPDGIDYLLRGKYVEVVKNERLVFTMDVSDHPEEWHALFRSYLPAGEKRPVGDLLNLVTFEEQEGRTKLTVRIRFDSKSVRDAMLKMGMTEGWSQSLERLKELTTEA